MKLYLLLLFGIIISVEHVPRSLLAANKNVLTATTSDILRAMHTQCGYDATATTNVARFQAGVLYELAKTLLPPGAGNALILVGHKEWFRAYLRFTGLTASTAPQFSQLAFLFKQDQLIECQPHRVIQSKGNHSRPAFVLNVTVQWPENANLPRKYSFEDTLSQPRLKVTNHRVVRYQLIHSGEMVIYNDIRGLTGRPLSGVLATLFKIIGEGRIVQSKTIVTQDGLQVVRAKARKGFFTVNTTLTVQPDGRAQKGIPPDRPDLAIFERLLKEKHTLRQVDPAVLN